MSNYDDCYDPEPDYDRPSTNREAMADEAGMPERDDEWVAATYRKTNKENTVDPTENIRRDMIATNQPAVDLLAELGIEGPTWTTETVSQEFEITGFMAPFVVVKRKSDGQKGSLEFTHSPRIYFNFQAAG
jgi:hypothetical protein